MSRWWWRSHPNLVVWRNWLQTIAGKSFFVCLRMYGPTEPWIEGSWRPSDVELVG